VCDGPLAPVPAPGPQRTQAPSGELTDAILEVVAAAEPAVGRTRTVEILRGGRSKVVRKYGYDELPGYGEFGGWRAEEVLARVDELIDAGRLRSTGGKFPKLQVVELAA
jgi:ATP-dependent DNA helicase RecQ